MPGLPRHIVGAQAALRLAGLSRDLRPTANLLRKLRCDKFHGPLGYRPSTKLQKQLLPRQIARKLTRYGTEYRGTRKPRAIRHHWKRSRSWAYSRSSLQDAYDVHGVKLRV